MLLLLIFVLLLLLSLGEDVEDEHLLSNTSGAHMWSVWTQAISCWHAVPSGHCIGDTHQNVHGEIYVHPQGV